ncbi:hypothetical protein C7999DRAFT_12807 [Corynascus novoguineensis]|uniref:F-box domain-containing protein n=1 Tax=Corynascus novoguineensis TaxID=1126955 RepID=A0AAN7CVV5_9PEZI|nr:hypothetical protein C7999DRAFT_12807 [Corynascus novoguineensis]
MWGPGGVGCIIHFICHIPAGMMVDALVIYTQVDALGDIYDVIPHGKTFKQGMQFLGYGGTVTFAWNFVMFGASPFCRGSLLGLVGVINLALATILFCGVSMTGQFLPHGYGPCNDARNWNNGSDGRNFFVEADINGSFGDERPGADNICSRMVKNWIMGIVVLLFFLICAVIDIIIGFSAEPGSRTSFGSPPQYDIDGVWHGHLFKPIRILLVPFGRVFQIVRATLWISIRYIFKFWDHCKEESRHKIKQLCKDAPTKGSSNLENNDLRLPMELVLMIIQYLHHTDLVSLGLSSKYLRTAFFGSDEPAQVAKDLRRFSCKDEGPIKYCAVCSIPTCQGCRRPKRLPNSAMYTHLTRCRVVCSGCFFWNHCVNRNKQGAVVKPDWERASRGGLLNRRGARLGAAMFESSGYNFGDRLNEDVCHRCVRLTQRQTQEILDARYVREMQSLAKVPKICFQCRRALPKEGVRWWVDPLTHKECKVRTHPGWVKAD